MVAPGAGRAWLLQGGACVVAPRGGMRGFSRGAACMVFARGGMHGFSPGGHAWFFLGGACIGYDEIWSMSGRYASYWNAFLFFKTLLNVSFI